MKYGRMFVLMALSAVMVVAATGCKKEDKGKEETASTDAITGKWINYRSLLDEVITHTLQFNRDGSGVESTTQGDPDESFFWKLEGSDLSLALKGENISATFDGETIIVKFTRHCRLYIKEGDKGPGEEASRKNLIGTWRGSIRDDGRGETYTDTYVFSEDGKGSYTKETTYKDGKPANKESGSFTWTLTGVKLVLKSSGILTDVTCYNGKKVLCIESVMKKQ